MRNLLILLLLTLFSTMIFLFFENKYTSFQIEFEKLRPVNQKINIYYNGFKIGRVKDISLCETSKNVCAYAILNRSSLFLPKNLTAKMKQKRINDNKYEDFIELIYPKTPSEFELKNGDTIRGTLNIGFHNYLNEELDFNEAEKMKLSFLKSVENLENASSLLVDVLNSVDEIASEAKKEAAPALKNMNRALKNAEILSNKLNSSVNESELKNILSNLNSTSAYANDFSYNVKTFTQNINSTDTINSVESIMQDTSEITRGVKCTLKKPFGGLRLIFGKVIR